MYAISTSDPMRAADWSVIKLACSIHAAQRRLNAATDGVERTRLQHDRDVLSLAMAQLSQKHYRLMQATEPARRAMLGCRVKALPSLLYKAFNISAAACLCLCVVMLVVAQPWAKDALMALALVTVAIDLGYIVVDFLYDSYREPEQRTRIAHELSGAEAPELSHLLPERLRALNITTDCEAYCDACLDRLIGTNSVA